MHTSYMVSFVTEILAGKIFFLETYNKNSIFIIHLINNHYSVAYFVYFVYLNI